MTSNIDPTVPVFGNPTTQSVRNNFAIAKTEIEALQGAVGLNVPVSIAQGGTGATTASGALTNLGAMPLAGGTFTGPILLSGNPTDLLGAVTKQYVDAYFPVSVARGGTGANNVTQALFNLGGAPIASPVFSGLPQAPTAPSADSSAVLATTAFVHSITDSLVSGVSRVNPGTGLLGGGTGSVTVSLLTPVPVGYGGTGSTTAAGALNNLGGAPLVNAQLLGQPTAPNPPDEDNSNNIATTSWVVEALEDFAPTVLTSPVMTGTPTAPTAAPGTNTTQIATTAFVNTSLNGYLKTSGGTMTGAITLAGAPANPLEAATKAYVDGAVTSPFNFKGNYRVAANVPVLPGTPANGDSYTCVTADPTVGEATVVALTPLPIGTVMYNGDLLRYVTGVGWTHVLSPYGGLSATEGDQRYVRLIGASMTGALYLSADPSVGLQAATKRYVDLTVSGAIPPNLITSVSGGIGLSGGGSSGAVTLSLTVPVTVAYGGTGSTTAAGALTALGAAPLDSPSFTGVPVAPNPGPTDVSSKIATTSWVNSQNYIKANQTISLTGDVVGSGTTSIATAVDAIRGIAVSPTAPTNGQFLQYNGTAWVPATVTGAPVNSPAFTGIPTAPTAATADISTQIATTAFVNSKLVAGWLPITGGTLTGRLTLSATPVGALEAATKGYVDGQLAGSPFLSLAGGALTGPISLTTANLDPIQLTNVSGTNHYIRFTKAGSWDWGVGVQNNRFTASKDNGSTLQMQVWDTGDLELAGSYLTFINKAPGGIGTPNTGPFMYGDLNSFVWQLGQGTDAGWFWRNSATTQVASVTGTGDLQINGTAYKPGGGAWVATSSRSMKDDIVPYKKGLDAVVQLNPVSFKYKGQPTDQSYIGLISEETGHMPEMHRTMRAKAKPEDKEESDVPALDSTAVTFALVNAVKEIVARLNKLEGKSGEARANTSSKEEPPPEEPEGPPKPVAPRNRSK